MARPALAALVVALIAGAFLAGVRSSGDASKSTAPAHRPSVPAAAIGELLPVEMEAEAPEAPPVAFPVKGEIIPANRGVDPSRLCLHPDPTPGEGLDCSPVCTDSSADACVQCRTLQRSMNPTSLRLLRECVAGKRGGLATAGKPCLDEIVARSRPSAGALEACDQVGRRVDACELTDSAFEHSCRANAALLSGPAIKALQNCASSECSTLHACAMAASCGMVGL